MTGGMREPYELGPMPLGRPMEIVRHYNNKGVMLSKDGKSDLAMTDYKRGVTFNVGRITGGTADNVVPAVCEATIDMRVRTFADAEIYEALFRQLKSYNPDVRVEVGVRARLRASA